MTQTGKIRLLVVSDWADTGFGRVCRELLPRLAGTDNYEIEMVAWVYDGNPDVFLEAYDLGIKLHCSLSHSWGRDWGMETVKEVAPIFDPDIILTLGDPWMVSWVQELSFRNKIRWVAYVPIDREPISFAWTNILKQPDCLVLYSKFGQEAVAKQLRYQQPQMIYHGVDVDCFRPLSPKLKALARRKNDIEDDHFIVGMVCRNQERKQVPRGIAAFKAFNCTCCRDVSRRSPTVVPPTKSYDCPLCGDFQQDPAKTKTFMYLHMTMGDGSDPDDGRGVAWNIHELVTRFGLKNRMLATPGITVKKGIPTGDLGLIYNLFDVHLLPTKREGFGLPVLETMSCGIPNLVTNYSACAELVEQGGGELIDVECYVNEPHDESDSAIISIADAAEKLDCLFADPELREQIAIQSRKFAESMTWEATIPQWQEVLHGVLGRDVPRQSMEQVQMNLLEGQTGFTNDSGEKKPEGIAVATG